MQESAGWLPPSRERRLLGVRVTSRILGAAVLLGLLLRACLVAVFMLIGL